MAPIGHVPRHASFRQEYAIIDRTSKHRKKRYAMKIARIVDTVRRNAFIPFLLAMTAVFSGILLAPNIKMDTGQQHVLIQTLAYALMTFCICGLGLLTGFFRLTHIQAAWIVSIGSLMALSFIAFCGGINTSKEEDVGKAIQLVLAVLGAIAMFSYLVVNLVKMSDKSRLVHISWLPTGGTYKVLSIVNGTEEGQKMLVLESIIGIRLVKVDHWYTQPGLDIKVGRHYSINRDGKLFDPIASLKAQNS